MTGKIAVGRGVATEDAPPQPMSPYGTSKLMTEMMLEDVGAAHDLRYVILRYFNVAGADPRQRTGQSTPGATHLIKVAVQTALGMRPQMEVFGTDYPTPDGTGIRDYIHVCDLVNAHSAALAHLRAGGASMRLNCGYGRGYSVLETIEAVRRVSGRNFAVQYAPRRAGDIMTMVADTSRIRSMLDWTPQLDDLDTIAAHALAWEERLFRERNGEIQHAVETRLCIRDGQRTADGRFSLEEVECLASCGTAPVLQLNNAEYHENLSVEQTLALLDRLARE